MNEQRAGYFHALTYKDGQGIVVMGDDYDNPSEFWEIPLSPLVEAALRAYAVGRDRKTLTTVLPYLRRALEQEGPHIVSLLHRFVDKGIPPWSTFYTVEDEVKRILSSEADNES